MISGPDCHIRPEERKNITFPTEKRLSLLPLPPPLALGPHVLFGSLQLPSSLDVAPRMPIKFGVAHIIGQMVREGRSLLM